MKTVGNKIYLVKNLNATKTDVKKIMKKQDFIYGVVEKITSKKYSVYGLFRKNKKRRVK